MKYRCLDIQKEWSLDLQDGTQTRRTLLDTEATWGELACDQARGQSVKGHGNHMALFTPQVTDPILVCLLLSVAAWQSPPSLIQKCPL